MTYIPLIDYLLLCTILRLSLLSHQCVAFLFDFLEIFTLSWLLLLVVCRWLFLWLPLLAKENVWFINLKFEGKYGLRGREYAIYKKNFVNKFICLYKLYVQILRTIRRLGDLLVICGQ
jgi:hypothetical protein